MTAWKPPLMPGSEGLRNIFTSLSKALRALNVRLLGRTSSSLSGGTPPAADAQEFLVQAGNTTVTTDASGFATISFPQSFPGGALTVVTASNSGGARASVASGSQTGFTVISNLGSTTMTIRWLAIGW